jgi:superfamily I DNA/RNA helicase
VLAITFTRNAAEEMRKRLSPLLCGRPASRRAGAPPAPPVVGVQISTIHAFCLRVCRRHLSRLKRGFDENFSVANKHEQLLVVKEAVGLGGQPVQIDHTPHHPTLRPHQPTIPPKRRLTA